MKKFAGRFRIDSTRLKEWDYSREGFYFVTTCIRAGKQYFGEIADDEMELSKAGKIAERFWTEIPEDFPHVELDEFIIMPNHIHGIIFITGFQDDSTGDAVKRDAINRVSTDTKIHGLRRDAIHRVSVRRVSVNNPGGVTGAKNPMVGREGLARIIRWFKGRTTFEIRKSAPDFAWQSRFYEHVIRNEKSLDRIREYIAMNPSRWSLDENNPANIPETR